MANFSYLPTPRVLHWLSGGQLANRLLRSVRCWVWLSLIYGDRTTPTTLPEPFRYGDLRRIALAPSHPHDDTATVADMNRQCQGSHCLCQVPASELLFRRQPDLLPDDWIAEVSHLSGLSTTELEHQLGRCPFATVHRTLRDDLAWLAQRGWLTSAGRGKWAKVAPRRWPQCPISLEDSSQEGALNTRDKRELLHLLEPIAFLHPHLDVVVDNLWKQLTSQAVSRSRAESPRRIFVHLDYILSDDLQEQVDQHQEDIEQLWHSPDGGVIQFDYWLARSQQSRRVTTYPVCFHYARRAKYLSAYGQCPDGSVGWHNYRMDRIQSPPVKVLAWGDRGVPKELKALRQAGQLPTPQEVEDKLEEAWGFNFYLPRGLLIMRFDREFARWYVQDTKRHDTFAPVAYGDLAGLVKRHINSQKERQILLKLIAQRPATDAYYRGWIRLGDINVTMRLRDWRPNGEVIAPLVVRNQMKAEVQQEMEWYVGR
jgi:CRISPR-associated protein (TIGR03985 family)